MEILIPIKKEGIYSFQGKSISKLTLGSQQN